MSELRSDGSQDLLKGMQGKDSETVNIDELFSVFRVSNICLAKMG